jgi:hypothetical protein
MFAIVHGQSGRLTVKLASANQESLFTSHDRGLCVKEASWMNLVLDMSADIEDTDFVATSPHTGEEFTVSGPVSDAQVALIHQLVGAA